MPKRKVLHVVRQLDFGGVESRIKILAFNDSLSELDHTFCAIGRGGAASREIIDAGIPITILGERSKILSVRAIIALVKIIKRVEPDIIHTRGAEANFHGIIAGYICRVPVLIAEEIGFPRHSRKARCAFAIIYRISTSVLAISNAVKEELIALGEVERDKVRVLFNPVRMLPERNAPTDTGNVELGFVGRLEEVKNPISLVRASAILRDRGVPVRTTIVGDGSQRNFLEQEIRRLDLEGVVLLIGYKDRPFDEIMHCSLYVQPSLSEGFGLALVEAMSAGIPVLATGVGGTREIVEDDISGWLLRGTDPETIASQVQEILTKESVEIEEVGRRGRTSVNDRFSPAMYFKKCDGIYNELLKVEA